MNDVHQNLPKYAKELLRFSATTPQFVLFGDVYDIFPLYMDSKYIPLNLPDFLGGLLGRYGGYELVVEYIPLEGFRVVHGKDETYRAITNRNISDRLVVLNDVYTILEKLVNALNKCAALLNFSSRLSEISCNRDLPDFLYRTFRLCLSAKQKGTPPVYNPLIFIVEKENDMPAWYTLDNPSIRSIPIPKPDLQIRRWLGQSLLPKVDGWNELSEEKRHEVLESFVDLTNGMYAREMLSIVSIAMRDNLNVSNIGEAVRLYKIGVSDNPWAKIDKEKLKNAEEILSKRVIGQEKAVKKAASILRRSFYNLSGAQFSRYSNKPKGILFFAGPTGVGKTELAKAITELIFGSESNYIRFDMSEFAHEHADQRLVGAPPGYVGYEVGGQLTNAVKQNPFSVVLFDEIEKAHPRILDIFLQILDDGRLTSGRGETVYFSECLIIFTSNLGVYEVTPTGEKIQRVSPEMPYEKIEEKILEAIRDFFKFKIGRPEILNRIGENIVVFDFMRPENARLVMKKMMRNVVLKLQEEHKIKIIVSPQVEDKIYERIITDLSMGGRGIGNKLESLFVNPMSELLFNLFPGENSTVTVEDVIEDGDRWQLKGYLSA
uniref:ATP-dependent Clp protease ATP-binding subunit n=1 Tax=Pseudothermotoga hypogea TaxID=57487 RepID=A0A832I6S1_9THEM